MSEELTKRNVNTEPVVLWLYYPTPRVTGIVCSTANTHHIFLVYALLLGKKLEHIILPRKSDSELDGGEVGARVNYTGTSGREVWRFAQVGDDWPSFSYESSPWLPAYGQIHCVVSRVRPPVDNGAVSPWMCAFTTARHSVLLMAVVPNTCRAWLRLAPLSLQSGLSSRFNPGVLIRCVAGTDALVITSVLWVSGMSLQP